MTAWGVNKTNLPKAGKCIFLVIGYDELTGDVLLSVPPEHDPNFIVSVDTLEHKLIYHTFLRISAILHIR